MNAIVSVYFLSFTSDFRRKGSILFLLLLLPPPVLTKKRCFAGTSCIISLQKSVYLFVKIVCRYTLNIGSAMELAVVRRHLSNFRFRVYNGREWAESIGDNHTGVLRIHRALTLNIIIFQSSVGGEGTSTTVI